MPIPNKYFRINNILNDILLRGRYNNRQFYLSLNNNIRDEVTKHVTIKPELVEELIARIVGDSLDKQGDPYAEHLEIAGRWKRNYYDTPPPFTAILIAMSYAAEQMAADGDFGAGNYYDRLGNVLHFPADPLRFHGKSSHQFWLMFNRWLEWNDYELGRPTARQLTSLKYVSFPQSQAIVRAGDRHLFHDLFKKFGFSRNDQVSAEDIQVYLENWILSSSANDRLKAAWSRPELRPRIAEVVIAELESWANPEEEATGNGSGTTLRLSLVASLVQQFPKPALSLYLGLRGEVASEKMALEQVHGSYSGKLAREAFGGIATVSPNPIAVIPGTMSGGITLQQIENEILLSWPPRLAIPLSQSTNGPYWIETSRLVVGEQQKILVRDVNAFRKDLDAYLSEVSDGKASVATGATVLGIPAGWVVYQDVFITRDTYVPGSDALKALCPLPNSMRMRLDDGMRLANGIWHSKAPPHISFVGTDGPYNVAIFTSGSDEECLIEVHGVDDSVDVPAMRLEQLEDGEYSVNILGGKRPKYITSENLVLRSSERPRPIHRQSKNRLSFSDSAISASSLESNETGFSIEGLVATPPLASLRSFQFSSLESAVPGGEVESSSVDWHTLESKETSESESCIERGYHYYICEPLLPGMPPSTPLKATCRDCGDTFVRRTPKKRGQSEIIERETKKIPLVSRPDQIRILPASAIQHDLFLDSLCFLGSDSEGKIESLLAVSIEQPWQAVEVAYDYSSLGFLDLLLEKGSGRIRKWSVPSPVICCASPTTAFLSGFRSPRLVKEICEATSSIGGSSMERNIAGQPNLVELRDIDPERLAHAVEGISDPLGRKLAIAVDAPALLSSAAHGLGYVSKLLQPVAIGNSGSIQRFRCQDGRWRDWGDIEEPGAYRVDHGLRIYMYRNELGQAFRGPHQVVKLLAARSEQTPLHSYNPQTKEFSSTLGAEPLGLLARVLVCSTGRLPARKNGMSIYSGVAENIASAVLSALYEEDL